MYKSLILVFFFLGQSSFGWSQGKYILFLKDKPECNLKPSDILDEKAIQRREKIGLFELKFEDYPLNPSYIQEIEANAETLRHQLKWFNAISVECSEKQISVISQLPFVKEVKKMGFMETCEMEPPGEDEIERIAPWQKGMKEKLLHFQREMLNMDTLKAHDLDGAGQRIAIFDAGFKGANFHPGLIHLWIKGQIIGTKNFFHEGKSVYGHSGHGTSVLGCIAGIRGGDWIGCAPGAEFLLARTEHIFSEKIIEEDNWLAAMEWAEAEGADIISSSLGYGHKRYEYDEMDGSSTLVTRAASIAARRGILVINAAGNDGGGKFKFISAPADGDSVLAVGGTNPMEKTHIKFSSFGPNALGKMKPNISAPGYVFTTSKDGGYELAPGTSFSCPLITGFAACVMQLYPEMTGMEVFQTLEEVSHLYPYYDYAHGYGIPDAKWLFKEKGNEAPTFIIEETEKNIEVVFNQDIIRGNRARIKNGLPLLFHIEGSDDKLVGYKIEFVREDTRKYLIPKNLLKKGTLRIWWEGYLMEFPSI